MFEAKEHKELIEVVDFVYVKESHFTKDYNISIESIDTESAVIRFPWSEHLIGSKRSPTMHGGAIASVLDMVGNMPVFARVISSKKGKSFWDRLQKIEEDGHRLSTVDLRIDFLRPGRSEYFIARSWILRFGSMISVSRMELENADQKLIASGTGTYLT